jgi:4-hydroxybenzoate polyprenyltransferase
VLRAYLDLVRPANVATAIGDVLAGFAVSGLAGGGALPWLLGSSACLYAGGVVLNDVFDRHVDAVERPERPLPSGRVDLGPAAGLGATLLVAGVLLARSAGELSSGVALAIAVAVVAYDARLKRHVLAGPLAMGACRGLNLTLGMTASPAGFWAHWPLGLIPTAYIAGITLLSRGEVTGGAGRTGTVALFLVTGAVASVVGVAAEHGEHVGSAFLLVAILSWRVLPPLVRARREPSAGRIRAAVKSGVLSLVLLDAALAAAFAGIGFSIVLVATALVALWLGRSFAVT